MDYGASECERVSDGSRIRLSKSSPPRWVSPAIALTYFVLVYRLLVTHEWVKRDGLLSE